MRYLFSHPFYLILVFILLFFLLPAVSSIFVGGPRKFRNRTRLVSEYGLPAADAVQIAADRELADLFEGAVGAGADAKPVANWIIGEVAPTGKFPTPEHLAELVKLVTAGSITRDQAREGHAPASGLRWM